MAQFLVIATVQLSADYPNNLQCMFEDTEAEFACSHRFELGDDFEIVRLPNNRQAVWCTYHLQEN